METFWKAVAIVLLTVVMSITIEKTEKDLSMVLTMAACCIVLMIAVQYLSEVIGFLWKLGNLSDIQTPFLSTLLKIAGVSLATEITGVISTDAGNTSLGKVVQILGNALILLLSVPLFETFVTMIQGLFGII